MAKEKKTVMTSTLVLQGILCNLTTADEEGVLGILLTVPTQGGYSQWSVVSLASMADCGYWSRDCWASVSYYLADRVMSEDELQESHLQVLFGNTKVRHGAHYSEMSGYLWTDDDFIVGGHNLIKEWKNSLGRFLYLKAEFHSEAPEGKGVR